MRTLNKPSDDPEAVYLTCISRVRDSSEKSRLQSIAKDIAEAAKDFDSHGRRGTFYRIDEHDNVAGVVSSGEMEKVYTARMASKKAPGRPIYDKLRASSPYATCPLCGHRTITTLDHYLPKATFPSLAVVPYNLVPACSDCNKAKLDISARTKDKQTLHPYYDDVSSDQWLFAEIIRSNPASAYFFVDFVTDWDNVLKNRIKEHFRIFELAALYTSQAGTELANIRGQLNNIYSKSGPASVKDHLLDLHRSRYSNHINSWQTALYQAMAICDWFCNGGFNAI